jgi:alkylation response protein AidB-like acyl-CoA dehydrogenase
MGGFGEMSAITGAMAAEELAYGELAVAMHILTPALFAYPVTLWGSDEQRESLLPLFWGKVSLRQRRRCSNRGLPLIPIFKRLRRGSN